MHQAIPPATISAALRMAKATIKNENHDAYLQISAMTVPNWTVWVLP